MKDNIKRVNQLLKDNNFNISINEMVRIIEKEQNGAHVDRRGIQKAYAKIMQMYDMVIDQYKYYSNEGGLKSEEEEAEMRYHRKELIDMLQHYYLEDMEDGSSNKEVLNLRNLFIDMDNLLQAQNKSSEKE